MKVSLVKNPSNPKDPTNPSSNINIYRGAVRNIAGILNFTLAVGSSKNLKMLRF